MSVGVGAELKRAFRWTRLLRWIPFLHVTACNCEQRARLMDLEGPDWCESNADLIVGWLREGANHYCLPFSERVARLLLRRAIHRTRWKLSILEF